MTPRSYSVDQLRGDILVDAMQKLAKNPKLLPHGYYAATVEPGVAMLVEPINAAPFVFVPPLNVHEFVSEPGSGTDFLRARIHASMFFTNVVSAARAQAAVKVEDAADTPRRPLLHPQ